MKQLFEALFFVQSSKNSGEGFLYGLYSMKGEEEGIVCTRNSSLLVVMSENQARSLSQLSKPKMYLTQVREKSQGNENLWFLIRLKKEKNVRPRRVFISSAYFPLSFRDTFKLKIKNHFLLNSPFFLLLSFITINSVVKKAEISAVVKLRNSITKHQQQVRGMRLKSWPIWNKICL